MTRRSFAAFAVLAAATVITPAFAAGKPDFSGAWKLNVTKSEFGAIPPPTFQTMKIDHKDPVLKVVTQQSAADGDTTINAAYSTDGKETKSDYRGTPTTSVAHWDADTLVIDTQVHYGGADPTIKATWKLSDDGKSITTNTHVSTPQGDFDIRSLFEKVK
jgi:hypothetical protein